MTPLCRDPRDPTDDAVSRGLQLERFEPWRATDLAWAYEGHGHGAGKQVDKKR